jgi:hypothetical protein
LLGGVIIVLIKIVGFIPKALFLERLARDRRSVSVFLLLSVLRISARFTPSLIRHGADGKAGEHFMKCAGQLVSYEMYEPTLDRAQAFFLLGIAEWGRGAKNQSSVSTPRLHRKYLLTGIQIHMGISVRSMNTCHFVYFTLLTLSSGWNSSFTQRRDI